MRNPPLEQELSLFSNINNYVNTLIDPACRYIGVYDIRCTIVLGRFLTPDAGKTLALEVISRSHLIYTAQTCRCVLYCIVVIELFVRIVILDQM